MQTGVAVPYLAIAFLFGGCVTYRVSEVAGRYESGEGILGKPRCVLILLNVGDYESTTYLPVESEDQPGSVYEAGQWSIAGSTIILRSRDGGEPKRLRLTSEGGIPRLTGGPDLRLEKKVYATLSPAEVEAAFARFQKLRLPMPFSDAWLAMGLPDMDRLSFEVHGGGSMSMPHFTRWTLTNRQPDGGHYTLTVFFRHPAEDGSAPALIYGAFFAYEFDWGDRPARILSDRGFYFRSLDAIEKSLLNGLPEMIPGQRPPATPIPSSSTP